MIRGSLLICFLIAFGGTSATGDRQQLRSDMLYSEGNRRAGQYRYGYAVKQGEKQFHHQRSLNGAMYGCYGFVDPQGKLFITHYLADMAGYRLVNMANPDKKLLQRIQSLGSADHPIELQTFFPLECQADGDVKVLQQSAAQIRSSLPTVQSSSPNRYAPPISNHQISGSTLHAEKTNLKSTDHVLAKLLAPTTTQVPQEMTIPQQPKSSPEKTTEQTNSEISNKLFPSSSHVKTGDGTANQRKYSIGSRFHSTKDFGSGSDSVYDPSLIRVKVVYDDADSLAARRGSPSVGTWFHSNPSAKLAENINKKELFKVPTNVVENGASLSKLTESVEMKHFQKDNLELKEAALDSYKEPAGQGASTILISGSDMNISAQDAKGSSKLSSENVGVVDGPLVISSLENQFSSDGIVGSTLAKNDNVKLNSSNDKNEKKHILSPDNVAVVQEMLVTGLSSQTDSQLSSESIVRSDKTESGELSMMKTSSPVLSSKNEVVHGSLLSGSVTRAESQQISEVMDAVNSKNTDHNRISEPKPVVKNQNTTTTESALGTDSQPISQNKEVLNSAKIKNVELRGTKATVQGTPNSSLRSEAVVDGNGSLATKSVSQLGSQEQHKLPELAPGVRQQSNSMFRGRIKYKDYASSSPQPTDSQRKTSYSHNSGQYKADNRGSFKSSASSGSSVGQSGQFNSITSAQPSFKLRSDTKTSGQKIQGSIKISPVSSHQATSANEGVRRGEGSMAAVLSTDQHLGNVQKVDKKFAESFKSKVGYSESIKAPAGIPSVVKSFVSELCTVKPCSTSIHVSESITTSKVDDSNQVIKKVKNISAESSEKTQVKNYAVMANVDGNVEYVTESNERQPSTLMSSTNPSSPGNIESSSGPATESSNSASLSQPTLRLTTGETVTGGLRLTDIRVSGSSWKSNLGNSPYQAFGDIKESVSASSGSFKSTLKSNVNSNQLVRESPTTEVKSDMAALLVQNGSLIMKADGDLGAINSLKYDSSVIQSGGDDTSSQFVPKKATNGSAHNGQDFINSLTGSSSVLAKQDESTIKLTSKMTTEDISRSDLHQSSSEVLQQNSNAIKSSTIGESSSQLNSRSSTLEVEHALPAIDDAKIAQQNFNAMKSSTIGESASQLNSRSSTLEVEPALPAIDDAKIAQQNSSAMKSSTIAESSSQLNSRSSTLEVEPAVPTIDNVKIADSDQYLGYTKVPHDEGSTQMLSKPSSVETLPVLRRVPAIRVPEYVEQTIRNQASSKSPLQPSPEHASDTRSTLDSKITSTSNSEDSIEQPYMDDTVVVEAALDDAQRTMIPKLPATPRTTTEASADSVTIAYSIPSYSHKPPVHPRPTTSYRPSISDTNHPAATVTTTTKPDPPVRTTIGPSGDIYDEIDEDVAPVSVSHPTQMSPQIPSIPNSGSGVSIQPSISSHCYEVILQIPANAKQVLLKTESSSFRVYGDGDPLNRVREVQPGVYEVNVGATGGIKFQQYQDVPRKDTDKLHLNLGKGFNYGDLVPIPANRGSVDFSDPSLNNPYLPQVTIEQARSAGSAEVVTVGEDSHELSTEQRALLNLVPSWKKVFLYY